MVFVSSQGTVVFVPSQGTVVFVPLYVIVVFVSSLGTVLFVPLYVTVVFVPSPGQRGFCDILKGDMIRGHGVWFTDMSASLTRSLAYLKYLSHDLIFCLTAYMSKLDTLILWCIAL